MKTCNEVMTANPACCLGSYSVEDAALLMKLEHIGPVPVVEDENSKKLIGIITDRDIVLKVIAERRDPQVTRIDEVMTRNPISCRATDDLDEVIDLMAIHQIRRVPVVDDNNCVIGIISQADLATRTNNSDQTAEVVKEISQPSLSESAK